MFLKTKVQLNICYSLLYKCLDERGQPKYGNSAVFVNGFELLLPDAHT